MWLTDEWPRTAHTPLLETRVNELLDRIFGDRRVQEAWVGVYKPNAALTPDVSASSVRFRAGNSRLVVVDDPGS